VAIKGRSLVCLSPIRQKSLWCRFKRSRSSSYGFTIGSRSVGCTTFQRFAVRTRDRGLWLSPPFKSVPYTVGLLYSPLCFRQPYPQWLHYWLWISYGLLFIEQLRAWWIPYLFRSEPERAARYRIMFGKTHSFLPLRNGLVPNTAHILLHLATVATLIVLFVR
jgi:hypothetical protein